MINAELHSWSIRWNIPVQALAELINIFEPKVDKSSEATSESATSNECVRIASNNGAALWRNNNGACMTNDGRMVRYGVANTSKKINEVFKSSDYIGITPIVITSKMIGQKIGIFTAVEMKDPNWTFRQSDKRSVGQNNFHIKVNLLGGIGMFCTDPSQYERIVKNG